MRSAGAGVLLCVLGLVEVDAARRGGALPAGRATGTGGAAASGDELLERDLLGCGSKTDDESAARLVARGGTRLGGLHRRVRDSARCADGDLPISVKTSTTPSPVLALVSKKSRPLSLAYSSASSRATWRLLSPVATGTSASVSSSAAGVAVASSASSSSEVAASSESSAEPGWTRSSLLPARAMTMLRGQKWGN